ncbi:MAG: hypothetical protein AW07_02514 [Candidatus Accumulibacter sp. SK-11]|nr:MAG: hypothetical protein AW07_02514 [Candidatus Accumulibacter sp. SK-11]
MPASAKPSRMPTESALCTATQSEPGVVQARTLNSRAPGVRPVRTAIGAGDEAMPSTPRAMFTSSSMVCLGLTL